MSVVPERPSDPVRPRRRATRPVLVVLAVAMVVLVATAGWFGARQVGWIGDDSRTVEYVVPDGAGRAVDGGGKVEVMPSVVRLHVGDRIVIRNRDDRTAVVGPYAVRPGETLVQRFERPQTIIGECTLAASGTVRIVVR